VLSSILENRRTKFYLWKIYKLWALYVVDRVYSFDKTAKNNDNNVTMS